MMPFRQDFIAVEFAVICYNNCYIVMYRKMLAIRHTGGAQT